MKGINSLNSRAKSIVIKERKREDETTKIELFLLFVAILSASALIILISSHLMATGYSVYISSRAGDITEVTLYRKFPATFWNGVYGLALRVPGFTEQLSRSFNNEIARQDLFFDCIATDDPNGNEIYASTSPIIDFDTLAPGNLTELESYMGCSGMKQCAINTFSQTMWVMVGSTNISNIPSTYTYKWDGDNRVFNIGYLQDGSGNRVFVTNRDIMQKGYSEEVTVNFQMLLPTPEYTSQIYYFFTDPYDECPAGGGIGEVISANVYGYVLDSIGSPIESAIVTFLGFKQNTTSNGFFNITADVTQGNYTLVAERYGYDINYTIVPITFENYTVETNITLLPETPAQESNIITPHIHGYVKTADGLGIYEAIVRAGGSSDLTDLFGYYSIYPTLLPGEQLIMATKEGYNNNVTYYNFTHNTTDVQLNFSLREGIPRYQDLVFETGPFQEQRISDILEQVVKSGEDYWVSTKEIKKEVRKNTFIEDVIGIYNFGAPMSITVTVPDSLSGIVTVDQTALTIPSNTFGEILLTIYGIEDLGIYTGNITIGGSLNQEIPTTIEIIERRMPIETMLIGVELFDDRVQRSEKLKYKITLKNLLSDQGYMVYITSKIKGTNNTIVYAEKETRAEIGSTLTLLEEIELPSEIPIGEYVLEVQVKYLNLFSRTSTGFYVVQPIYLYAFFGIPLWIYLAIISFLSFILLNVLIYKKHMEKKKRYSVSVDYNSLPGPGERTVRLGHIAETKKDAYLEIDKLTVHTIVAGATGMGKSISAQVIIEEALMKNVCVIVFDPTAQWSGMLRKCEDKKMFVYYQKFGMKPTDARGFPGNIRAVKDARQIIDINKYFEPGHIQIFTLNKLQPKDMDIFVANTIRQVFKSDPKESQELKILLVFDEVHRLLPKFGGSGQGFLQIERGCREFRKWGLGQILISQVMNDFVGEIKANINTEVQTRTVEEGDLERIKGKFGESFLKSLVKSEVGVAMFQNAEYNKGLPYFISFRPILHNTRRLSDEELEKYNQYNDRVDDLEYQIEQLEELKIDVFDLKMEIKLVKDKIMTGNFSVVDIYLEGLTPRVAKQWEKLGKKPKKLEIKLADLSEIEKSVEEAKAERKKAESKEAAKEESKTEVKKDPMEELNKKQLSSITFDNGAMASSLSELKDMLPTLDDEIFKTHVNAQKNDISEWFKQLSPTFSTKLKPIIDKNQMVKEINDWKGDFPQGPQAKAKSPTNPTQPPVKK